MATTFQNANFIGTVKIRGDLDITGPTTETIFGGTIRCNSFYIAGDEISTVYAKLEMPTLTGLNVVGQTAGDPVIKIYPNYTGAHQSSFICINNTGVTDGSPNQLILGSVSSATGPNDFCGYAKIDTARNGVSSSTPLSIRCQGTEHILISPDGVQFKTIPSCAVAPTTTSHLCNKSYVDSIVQNGASSVAGSITATSIGLGNVNNTSDADKQVSTATATQLSSKAPLASPQFTTDINTPKVTLKSTSTNMYITSSNENFMEFFNSTASNAGFGFYNGTTPIETCRINTQGIRLPQFSDYGVYWGSNLHVSSKIYDSLDLNIWTDNTLNITAPTTVNITSPQVYTNGYYLADQFVKAPTYLFKTDVTGNTNITWNSAYKFMDFTSYQGSFAWYFNYQNGTGNKSMTLSAAGILAGMTGIDTTFLKSYSNGITATAGSQGATMTTTPQANTEITNVATVHTITVNPLYIGRLNINCPMSFWIEHFSNSGNGLDTSTRSFKSATCNIYKNGDLFLTPTVTSSNRYNITKYYKHSQNENGTAEQYVTNLVVDFEPVCSVDTVVYTVELRANVIEENSRFIQNSANIVSITKLVNFNTDISGRKEWINTYSNGFGYFYSNSGTGYLVPSCTPYYSSEAPNLKTGSIACANIVIANGSYLKAGNGMITRAGSSGGYGGNNFNTFWTGTVLQCWVDTTNIGNFTICDYRLKQNVEFAPNVLDRLCSIPMITYNYNNVSVFKDNGSHIGFYAHDLQNAFPELENIVTGKKDDADESGEIKIQTVNAEFTHLLMKAIQEQNEIIKNLQARILLLESKIS